MSKQTINIGASPNDGTGTPLRTSFDYTNQNFTELYTAVGPSGNNIVVPGTATITGDLTVDTSTLKVDSTNNRVGIGTATPGVRCDILSDNNTSLAPVLRVNSNNVAVNTALAYDGLIGSSTLTIQSGTSAAMIFNTNNVNERYRIASDGVATWSNVGGVAGTAMTLNSTGLGIGVTPSAGKFEVLEGGTGSGAGGIYASTATAGGNAGYVFRTASTNRWAINLAGSAGVESLRFRDENAAVTRMTIDSSGNVGIGVTPSAWRSTQRALQIGAVGTLFSGVASNGSTCIGRNVYESTAGDFTYIVNDEATLYEQTATGTHAWYTAAAGTGTIAFGSPKMTLDASGNLILLSSATPATLATNGQLTVNATSNTNLRFSYRGSDGTTRVANITLA